MRTYVYVDGENHFIRTMTAAKTLFGSSEALSVLIEVAESWASPHLPDFTVQDSKRFGYMPSIQFVWDYCGLYDGPGYSYSYPSNDLIRAVYFTSCVGDGPALHTARVALRDRGFEPQVIEERKQHKKQREQSLEANLIEKPKAVDIALAARMISDAASDLFDKCHLFSSDGDFIPVIEAVRRTGKIVWVHGHADTLPKESPLLFVPDAFIDIGKPLRNIEKNYGHQIREKLAADAAFRKQSASADG